MQFVIMNLDVYIVQQLSSVMQCDEGKCGEHFQNVNVTV